MVGNLKWKGNKSGRKLKKDDRKGTSQTWCIILKYLREEYQMQPIQKEGEKSIFCTTIKPESNKNSQV
jgi:hypothetical protein